VSDQLLPQPRSRALVEASATTLWWEVRSVLSKAVKCRQPSHFSLSSVVETTRDVCLRAEAMNHTSGTRRGTPLGKTPHAAP